MKTKTKTLAVVEIAIVLCSMLLVSTLPAIAAANEKTYKHTDLDVFGNANEDDTIDMRDTTYIKLAIFGKKPKTDLADANYDEKVSMLDVGQTKLIILGKEKELTLIDDIGAIVTITMPLERIISIGSNEDAIRAVGAKDRIVAVTSSVIGNPTFYPELSKKPSFGTKPEVDIEKIMEFEPDIVFGHMWTKPEVADQLKGAGIQFVCIYPRNEEWEAYNQPAWPPARVNMIKLGYVLGEVENAREYVEWYDSIVDTIKERVSEIPEDEKPKVFMEDDSRGGMVERKASGHIMGWKAAGANRIGPGTEAVDRIVSVEWIIDQNPDVYVARLGSTGSYQLDEGTDYKAYYDEIKEGVPGFEFTNAVKDNRVHVISGAITYKIGIPIGIAYQAKWYYPELFEDLDPQELHQEYVDTFCPGLDFDVSEHGVFVYPPIE